MITITGHRGAAGIEPENTLLSIQKAIDLGVDQIEIDGHLTKDGKLVVIHDSTVDRTTNGHGHVKDFTLEEIKKLDAGKGEQIPTLQEVLNLTLRKVILQIELKGPGTAEVVVQTIEENKAEKEVLITSFRHEMLEEVHRLNPNLELGALFGELRDDPCQRAIDIGAKAIHVNFHHINADLVNKAHTKGLKIRAWNPDTAEEMQRMIDLSVDAIGTNRPDILLKLLKS